MPRLSPLAASSSAFSSFGCQVAPCQVRCGRSETDEWRISCVECWLPEHTCATSTQRARARLRRPFCRRRAWLGHQADGGRVSDLSESARARTVVWRPILVTAQLLATLRTDFMQFSSESRVFVSFWIWSSGALTWCPVLCGVECAVCSVVACPRPRHAGLNSSAVERCRLRYVRYCILPPPYNTSRTYRHVACKFGYSVQRGGRKGTQS